MKYDEMIEEARKLCACLDCQGGYQVGSRTMAARMELERPRTCVAAVVLADMLSRVGLLSSPLPPVETGKPV